MHGGVAEDFAGNGEGAGPGDLAVGEHFGESQGERLASVAGGDPGGFFPAEGVVVGEAVGAEEHLVGEGFEQLAEPGGLGAWGKHEGLLREVQIDVWFLQQGVGFADEGPAAVQHDEVGVAELGVVEEGFEQQGIRAGDAEVASATG